MTSFAGFERAEAQKLLASSSERRKYLFGAFWKGGAFGLLVAVALAASFNKSWFGGIEQMLLTPAGLTQVGFLFLFLFLLFGLTSWAGNKEAVDKLLRMKKDAEEYRHYFGEDSEK